MMPYWFRWWLGAEQATSHYLIEWWPSSLTHISVAGNKGIVIYGECCYAMQRHRFTMNYQKARCNTQHQPPPYASTSTQRGYADFRRHLPSSLVIRWLAFIRYQNCLCVFCCTSGIESTWIKISITVTLHEHQPVPRQLVKNIKTLHYWSVVRRNRCSPMDSLAKGQCN